MDNNIKIIDGLDKNLLKIIKIRVDSFQQSLEKTGLEINLNPDLHHDLSMILLCSEFICASFIKNPQIFHDLIKSNDLFKSYSKHAYIARLEKNITKNIDLDGAKTILLQIKLYESIRIAWRDLTGSAKLEETLEDLSNLADAILDTAMTLIYDETCKLYGTPVDLNGNFQRIIV